MLENLSPGFRSRLSSIQLIALTKTSVIEEQKELWLTNISTMFVCSSKLASLRAAHPNYCNNKQIINCQIRPLTCYTNNKITQTS